MGAVVGILLESLISIFKKGKPHSAMDCLARSTRGKKCISKCILKMYVTCYCFKHNVYRNTQYTMYHYTFPFSQAYAPL